MLVLFDQCTPVGIRRALTGHTVKTANEMGWSTLTNGDLLRAAEMSGFNVLLTTDRNLQYQQNFHERKLGAVVVSQNRWRLVRKALPKIVAAIESSQPGVCTLVDISE